MSKCEIRNLPNMDDARKRVDDYIIKTDEIISSTLLKSFAKDKKYFIRTYGCQANIRDEESMRGMLEGVGFTKVEEEKDADLIIINTCAVRENAEDKVYGEIGNLKRLKQAKKDLVIAICGCIPEEPEILERILNTYPYIFSRNQISLLQQSLFAY